jgi:excisionase family DNA binding protein
MDNPLAKRIPALHVPPLGMRVADAARTLGISPSTLQRLTKAGEIKCIKLNRAKIYPYEELQRWMACKTYGGMPTGGRAAGGASPRPS